ncbi:MBL fold metallo-hydrolase [Tenggerimyces flavus]|uniref:MBL fold metallo-hydrolase n=1 Tax=Tenggerimyces flavus TaxID=1708749 RepID=A0ABV7YFF0_9ACTN|nr:MBL fold metallo-hydrolase [Tenggerimyces flavus]MBM7789256.1 glyoxylase-like metal-dependent hydrolase (beta-lactamase superfamily II) [Tenggerimyces flavus]
MTSAGGQRGWVEVGERCWARTYGPFDTTVGVVAGAGGLLVVDTLGSPEQGAELAHDLPVEGEVRWVVNTHGHIGHIGGNAAFPDVERWQHETLAEREGTRSFASVAYVDLGDRLVELAHPGRGHTEGDVVVRVPDANVLFTGDVVIQNGPPAYGADSFPMDWPKALDVVLGLLTETTVAVPGHGSPTDRDFVTDLVAEVSAVADAIQHLVSTGVQPADALAATDWPFPRETLVEAIRRGYEHLGGPTPPRLPLLPA